MSNTPSPSPFCCGEGYALSIQGPLRKGAEEEDSGLWGGKVGKKKEEITNTKGKCKGNHCTSPRRSSLALGCVVPLCVWVGLCVVVAAPGVAGQGEVVGMSQRQ